MLLSHALTGKAQEVEADQLAPLPSPVDTLCQLQFYKTTLCRYFGRPGGCEKGAACGFAHGTAELRTRPDLTKTSICKAWQAGTCLLPAEACCFAHGENDRKTTDLFNTVLAPRHLPQSSLAADLTHAMPRSGIRIANRDQGHVLSALVSEMRSQGVDSNVDPAFCPIEPRAGHSAKPLVHRLQELQTAPLANHPLSGFLELRREYSPPLSGQVPASGKGAREAIAELSPLTLASFPSQLPLPHSFVTASRAGLEAPPPHEIEVPCPQFLRTCEKF